MQIQSSQSPILMMPLKCKPRADCLLRELDSGSETVGICTGPDPVLVCSSRGTSERTGFHPSYSLCLGLWPWNFIAK